MPPQNKHRILRGSFDEKLDKVDRLLQRMNRRQNNYVIGITPPIPVFDWVKEPDEDGVVFRKLMPGNGKITIGCLYIDELAKNLNPQAVLTVDGRLGGTSMKIPITRKAMSIKSDMPVEFGQRLTLAIEPIESCKGIWAAFLFEIALDKANKQKQLADGFLTLVEEADEELENA